MSEIVLPLADIKKRLSEIVDGVEQRHDRVLLTRNGRAAAVIMSPEDLEALEETLDILSDPRAMRAIRKAEVELSEGKFLSAEELRAKYLKRCAAGRFRSRRPRSGPSPVSPRGSPPRSSSSWSARCST